MGHSRPLFFFILVFSIQLTVNVQNKFLADDWIRTADLWNWKRPLYQLSHYHCPKYCLHYATITKHSNLKLIDRHQFPWLTVSIDLTYVLALVFLIAYVKDKFCLVC